jgi:hypothetical protein
VCENHSEGGHRSSISKNSSLSDVQRRQIKQTGNASESRKFFSSWNDRPTERKIIDISIERMEF